MIGIYKITNPKGAVYIGESKDIERRWNSDYKKLNCKGQRKLYNSFMYYGFENHTFEIVKECTEEEIPYYERYYQEYYNVLDRNYGLNCKLTKVGEKKEVCSEETRKKISEAQKKRFANGQIHPNKGKHRTEETKIKIRNSLKGKPSWNKGKNHSDEHKENLSENHWSKKEGYINPFAKKVINTETKEVYNSLAEMCRILGLSYGTMKLRLRGKLKNNTQFQYI
jgi:group I intron endonuclease